VFHFFRAKSQADEIKHNLKEIDELENNLREAQR
jgi:hypothetical protein